MLTCTFVCTLHPFFLNSTANVLQRFPYDMYILIPIKYKVKLNHFSIKKPQNRNMPFLLALLTKWNVFVSLKKKYYFIHYILSRNQAVFLHPSIQIRYTFTLNTITDINFATRIEHFYTHLKYTVYSYSCSKWLRVKTAFSRKSNRIECCTHCIKHI